MIMRKGLSKWDLIIEWFDDEKYDNLSEKEQDILHEFRRKNTYINKLNRSIDRDVKIISQLQKNIRKRRKKIRIHKLRGKKLYSEVEYLKNKHFIDIYYCEGIQKKPYTRTIKGVESTTYNQYQISNLKIKTKYLNRQRTISLKSTRNETLKVLKSHFPEWINTLDESKMKNNKNYFRNHLIEFFKPTLEKIVNEKFIELNNGQYILNLKKLIEEHKLLNR